jgi:hypothetical protein
VVFVSELEAVPDPSLRPLPNPRIAPRSRHILRGVSRAVPELTSDLDLWEVTLETGEVVRILAHGCKADGGLHRCVALMRGEPDDE